MIAPVVATEAAVIAPVAATVAAVTELVEDTAPALTEPVVATEPAVTEPIAITELAVAEVVQLIALAVRVPPTPIFARAVTTPVRLVVPPTARLPVSVRSGPTGPPPPLKKATPGAANV